MKGKKIEKSFKRPIEIQNKMIDLNLNIAVIRLNVNSLNTLLLKKRVIRLCLKPNSIICCLEEVYLTQRAQKI